MGKGLEADLKAGRQAVGGGHSALEQAASGEAGSVPPLGLWLILLHSNASAFWDEGCAGEGQSRCQCVCVPTYATLCSHITLCACIRMPAHHRISELVAQGTHARLYLSACVCVCQRGGMLRACGRG